MKKYIPFVSWVLGLILECITVATGVAWISIPAVVFIIAGYATDRYVNSDKETNENVDNPSDK